MRERERERERESERERQREGKRDRERERETQTNVQMDSSLEIREGIQIFDKFIINVFSTLIMFRDVLMNESLRYVSVFVQMYFTVWATYLPRISGLSSFHFNPFSHHLALKKI